MSLKSIDMQIAMQKSNEIGLKQNHLQHKPNMDQVIVAEHGKKIAENDRLRSSQVDKPDESLIQEHHQHENNKKQRQGAKKKTAFDKTPEPSSEHPFKGKHIDLSL